MKKLFNIGMLYAALFLMSVLFLLVTVWMQKFYMTLAASIFLIALTVRVNNYIKEEVNKINNK